MRIVMSHEDLSSYGGTETYMLTVAVELQRRGHQVTLFAHELGVVAAEARGQGIAVTDEESRLPATCGLVLAQDAGSAFVMAARYPGARRLFVAHSDFHALQSPPQLDGVCDAVVVMNERTGRFVGDLAHAPPVVRLEQPLDLRRFAPRGPSRTEPRTALLLGNYLRGPLVEALEAACRAAGLEPVQAGVHATATATPEEAIAQADVVIGLGRCIVEAMACERGAYVYGLAGGDGWVTPERYAALAADGFAGGATDDVLGPARITADLRAWTPEMGPANRLLASAHHNVYDHVHGLLALADDAPGPHEPPTQAAELARLVRLQWQTSSEYFGALEALRELREALRTQEAEAERAHAAAHDALVLAHRRENAEAERDEAVSALTGTRAELAGARAELADARAELAGARAELAGARAELERMREQDAALRQTRRFRVARGLAAPVDAARRRLRG